MCYTTKDLFSRKKARESQATPLTSTAPDRRTDLPADSEAKRRPDKPDKTREPLRELEEA